MADLVQWDYRDWSTAALVTEEEVLRWRMAMLDETPAEPECDRLCIESGMAMLADCILEIRAELDKRRAVYRNRHAPTMGTVSRQLPDIFAFVKERIDLEMLCARFGPILTPKGRDLWGLCPLPDHHEKTPSFHITPSKQQWKCFGCGRGGDLFHLAMYYAQLPRSIDAAKWLCAQFGLVEPGVEHSKQSNAAGSSYVVERADGTLAELKTPVYTQAPRRMYRS